MIYKIVLKGLKPGAEVYETHTAFLSADKDQDIDGLVMAHLYEWRNEHGYYKVKYMSMEII